MDQLMSRPVPCWVLGIRKLNDNHGSPKVDFIVQGYDVPHVLEWLRTTPVTDLPDGALYWWTKLTNQLNDEDEIAAGQKRHELSTIPMRELARLIDRTQGQTWGHAFFLITRPIEPIHDLTATPKSIHA